MRQRAKPGSPARTAVVWCPDWPITAAGIEPDVPAAVIEDGRVLARTDAARAEGVTRGQRQRDAQRRCVALVVIPRDHAREVAAFEDVVLTVEGYAPRVDVLRPGLCAFRSDAPSRHLRRSLTTAASRSGATPAGDTDLADQELADQVAEAIGQGARVGVADGLFAADLAARTGTVVPVGRAARFLAPLPVSTLNRPELVDALTRLGVRTLGDFAALPPGSVLARFGADGGRAHRLARGLDERPLAPRRPPPDLTVYTALDPPVTRVDQAAFAVKALADELRDRLTNHGLACVRVHIEAATEHGESFSRRWRHTGPLTSTRIAERTRWQLDGWITGSAPTPGRRDAPPTAGVSLLRLTADEVVPDDGHQYDLWGTDAEPGERVTRAVDRVRTMLGPDTVTTPVLVGGRGPADRVTWTLWDPERPAGGPRWPGREPAGPTWPGRLPAPSPPTVHPDPLPVEVVDDRGTPVTVSGRHVVSAPPAWLAVGAERLRAVGWAGPWSVDERWWEPTGRRRARLQVVTDGGMAWLLAREGGRWWIEAEYG